MSRHLDTGVKIKHALWDSDTAPEKASRGPIGWAGCYLY